MRLQKLDSWRFIAVSLVIISHLTYRLKILGIASPFIVWAEHLGRLGVEIFFFISGYIITLHLLKEKHETGFISIGAFYVRRTFRILPPLLIYILTIILLSKAQLIKVEANEAVYTILFLTNLNESFPVSWYFAHTWSLSYEEQFYILLPLVLLLINKKLILTAIIFPALSIILYILDLDIAAGFFRFFSFMFYGVIFATYNSQIISKVKHLRRLQLSIIISLLIFSTVGISLLPDNKYSTLVSVLTLPISISMLVFFTINNSTYMDRILYNRYFSYLGMVSYGLYLWQQLALAKYENSTFIFYVFFLIAVIIYTILQYELLEKKLILIGSSLSKMVKNR